MSNTIQDPKLLLPSNPIIKSATLTAFSKLKGVDMQAAEDFINKFDDAAPKAAVDVPAPLGAKADLIFGLIYGSVTVKPTSGPTSCIFEHSFWGVGAVGGSSIGFMYTAYDSWDAFFRNVTGFHVQGIASGGGILQVNWFISNGTPVGQFNGAMAGAGGVEGGNSGTWKC